MKTTKNTEKSSAEIENPKSDKAIDKADTEIQVPEDNIFYGLSPLRFRSEYQKQYQKDNKEILKDKKKQYYENNKIILKEKQKQYRENNKEIRKENQIQYYENNKEALKEYARQYRKNNKELLKEYHKEYREATKENRKQYRKQHSDIGNIYKQKRRALKKLLPNTLTIEQWNSAKQHFDNKCAYCGEEKPLEQEHFIALSKGGGYTMENIIPACKRCNGSKRAKAFEEWYPQQSYYSIERKDIIYKFLEVESYEEN